MVCTTQCCIYLLWGSKKEKRQEQQGLPASGRETKEQGLKRQGGMG
jgi:hypothetical protein